MSWIQTYTDKKFDLVYPTSDMVCREDIAHALSQLCRYTGHCKEFYSVAQHSEMVAFRVLNMTEHLGGTPRDWRKNDSERRTIVLAALLHDAHEAYIGDWSSPLKITIAQLMAGVRVEKVVETKIQQAIHTWAGVDDISLAGREAIKQADLEMLAMEKQHLLGPEPTPWIPLPPVPDMLWREPWEPSRAKKSFLAWLDTFGL